MQSEKSSAGIQKKNIKKINEIVDINEMIQLDSIGYKRNADNDSNSIHEQG